ncbi:hypothetical protein CIG75_08335 [Tumebacillus algifaecis]|uniref:Uncharacterized protein n=1 Tax=Tumebacillus algifaecis TaxID=1214604 RepID=A0A223D0P7_9BACL|nr:hypothetical protein [Tumebacillus algifaecis]ASS74993.1 hypothetical protein CIG75_08335 [Tumebacillus algifaecis]
MKPDWRPWLDPFVNGMRQTLDLAVAALLLSGQITVRSLILSTSSEFRLNLTGPIFGGPRTIAKGKSKSGALILDAVDVMIAFLLILNQLNVSGVFLQSQRFSLTVSGPAFGGSREG